MIQLLRERTSHKGHNTLNLNQNFVQDGCFFNLDKILSVHDGEQMQIDIIENVSIICQYILLAIIMSMLYLKYEIIKNVSYVGM